MGQFTQWLLVAAILLLGIYGWKILAVDYWQAEMSAQYRADENRTAIVLHEQ
jgi:hypothetical protein